MSTSNWYWSWVKSKELTAKSSGAVPQSGGTIYAYRAPERGQLSASQFKTSIDSISTNINQQWSLWNTHIRPILDSLPSGRRDERWRSGKGLPEKIDALSYGIQGTTLFVFNDANATNAYGRYWDTTDERPKTLAEAMEDIWQAIADIEVGTGTSSSSGDLAPLWSAIGNSYNGGADASGSLGYRVGVVEGQLTNLDHDLYSTDAGLGFGGSGWPTHGAAEFIHYLAVLHGVASGWNGGNPALVSHGSGYVIGPASATNLAIAIYDGTGGSAIKNSYATIGAAGSINIPTGQTYRINNVPLSTANITTPLTGFLYGDGSTISAVAIPAPTTITTDNESIDTTCFPLFVTSNTPGSLGPKTTSSFTFNSATGALGSTLFAADTVTANTAFVPDANDDATLGTTALQFSDLFLALGAVINFDNGASLITHSANTLTVGGSGATTLALGTNSLTMTGSIGATGARITKGWFTDLEVTNAIAGSITGNAATVTVADSTSATCFVSLFEAATGSLAAKTDAALLYNASTGLLTSTLLKATNKITLGALAGDTGSIELLGTTAGTLTVTIPDSTSTWTFTLPADTGTSGQYLKTDGAGVCTWATVGGGTASSVTISNELSDTTCFPTFVTNSIPGDFGLNSNPAFKYNAATQALTSTILAATNKITLGVAAGDTGSVEFTGTTSGIVTVKSADTAGTWTFTLPDSDGTDGYILKTDGNGVTDWIAVAAPLAHDLIDSVGHTVTGLTTGHFLKATGATTYDFGAHGLTAADVGAVADGDALLLDQTYPQSISNGFPTFDEGFYLGLTPTPGAHSTGKMYWDAAAGTICAELEDSVTLQIGQESQVYVYNNTGGLLSDGYAVYVTGAYLGVPTIALAKADAFATSYVLGVITSSTIPDGTYGYVSTFGHVNYLDTSAWDVGDHLYLSPDTAGELTNEQPSAPNFDVRVARVMVKHGGAGKIFVNVKQESRLVDLSDVTITTPVLDEVLRYNGLEWVNGAAVTSSASAGIEFFPDTTDIVAKTAENSFVIETLNKYPVTTAESVEAIACVSNTVIGSAYLYDTALGRTTIDAGSWGFEFYLSVDSVLGGRVSYATVNIYKSTPYTSPTVTITGTGTSRTCTAASGTPFETSKIDASADLKLCSFVRTPKGSYQITARTSNTVVTIAVPTGYTNESTVAFSVWKKLFGVNSPTITTTGTNYGLYSINTSQAAFTTELTDKLVMLVMGTSNNTTTVNYVYNGNTHYSHFSSPLITLHNDLAGLQGGSSNEFYHLTAAKHTTLTGLTTIAQGDIAYGSAANTWSLLNKSTGTNYFLKNSGTSNNPAWAAITAADIPVPTTITVAGESTDITCFPLFGTAATGALAPKSSAGWGLSSAHAYTGTGTATSGLPRMFLGTNTPSGDDSALLICRAVAGTDLFSHAVRDESTFTSLTTGAYASFDTAAKFTGATHYNHMHGFQCRMNFNGSDTVDSYQAFTSNPVITSGTAGYVVGLHVYDSAGAGIIQNQIAVWIDDQTKGTSTKYAIYSPGTCVSYHAGQFQIGAGGLYSAAGTIKMANAWSDNSTNSTAFGIGVPSSSYPGNYMSVFGHNAGKNLTSSGNNFNTFIGWSAGTTATTGSTNTYIGAGAGFTGNGSGNVALGKYSGYYETGSNKLFIDNDKRTNEADARIKALVYGIFDAAVANQYLTVNGNLTATQGLTLGADLAGGTPNTAGYLKLFSAGDNAFYSTFTAGTQTANAAYTLPTAPPTVNGMALTSTTGGVMSWATIIGGDSEDGMAVYKNIYGDFSAIYSSSTELVVFGLPFSITAVQIKKITRKPTGSAVSVVKNRGTDLVCTWTPDATVSGKGVITTTSLGTLASSDEYIIEIEGEPKGYSASVDANKTFSIGEPTYSNDGMIAEVASDDVEIVKSLLVDGYNAISLTVNIDALGDFVKVYGTNDPTGLSGFYDITALACGVSSVVASGAYQTPGVIMFPYIKIVVDGNTSYAAANLTRFLKK